MNKELALKILQQLTTKENTGIPVNSTHLSSYTGASSTEIDENLRELYKLGYVYPSGEYWYPTYPGTQVAQRGTTLGRGAKDYNKLQEQYTGFNAAKREKQGLQNWPDIIANYYSTFKDNHPEYTSFFNYLASSPSASREFIKDTQAIFLNWNYLKDPLLHYPGQTNYNRPQDLVSLEQAMDFSIRQFYEYVKSDRHRIKFNSDYRKILDSGAIDKTVEYVKGEIYQHTRKGEVISNTEIDNLVTTGLKNVLSKPDLTSVDLIKNAIVAKVVNTLDYSKGIFLEKTQPRIIVSGMREMLALEGMDAFKVFRKTGYSLIGGITNASNIISNNDFTGKNLEGIDFSGLDIANTLFNNANLSKSDWRESKVKGCNFTDTNFTGASFKPIKCTNNIFNGSNFLSAAVNKDIDWEENEGYPDNLFIRDVQLNKTEHKNVKQDQRLINSVALPIGEEDYPDAITVVKALRPIIERLHTISSLRKLAFNALTEEEVQELRKFIEGATEVPAINHGDNLFNFLITLNRSGELKNAGFSGKDINTLMGKARTLVLGDPKAQQREEARKKEEEKLQKLQQFTLKYAPAKEVPVSALIDLFENKQSNLVGLLQSYGDKKGNLSLNDINNLYHSLVSTIKNLHYNPYITPGRQYASFAYTGAVYDLEHTAKPMAGGGIQFGIALYPNYSAMPPDIADILRYAIANGSSHVAGAMAFSRIAPYTYTEVPVGKRSPIVKKVWCITEMQADDYQKIGEGVSRDPAFKKKMKERYGEDIASILRGYYRHWPENLLNVIITKAVENNVDEIWVPPGEEVAAKTNNLKVNWYNFYDRPAKAFGGTIKDTGVTVNLDPTPGGTGYKRTGDKFYVIDLTAFRRESSLSLFREYANLSLIKTAEYEWNKWKDNIKHHIQFFIDHSRIVHNEVVNKHVSDEMLVQWAYRTFFEEYSVPRWVTEDPEFVDEVRRIIIEDLGYNLYGQVYIDWGFWIQKAYDDLTWFIPKQRQLLDVNISDKELARDWWKLWKEDQIPADMKASPWYPLFRDTIRDMVIDMGLGDITDDTSYHLPEGEAERLPESERQQHEEGTEGHEYVDREGNPIEGPPEGFEETYESKEDINDTKQELIDEYLDQINVALQQGDVQTVQKLKQRLQELESISSQKLSWLGTMPEMKNTEFNLDATGDVVQGDVIQFKEAVFTGTWKKPVYAGDRIITGRVVKESYGEDKQQHTFTLQLLDIQGTKSDEYMPGMEIRRKGRNVYKNGVRRQEWVDETLRDEVANEKHERGGKARYIRNQNKSNLSR